MSFTFRVLKTGVLPINPWSGRTFENLQALNLALGEGFLEPIEEETMPCNYSFDTRDIHSIDFRDILSDTTRESPLAIIKTGNSAYVAIHKSIIDKAARLASVNGMLLSESDQGVLFGEEGHVYVSRSLKELGTWTQWVKKVKQARWPVQKDGAKKVTVRVTFPKI